MSKIPSFSRPCDAGAVHGAVASRSNVHGPRVAQSNQFKFNFKIFSAFSCENDNSLGGFIILTGKTVIDIQTTTTTGDVCCGFSLLTELPSVKGNLTSEPMPPVSSCCITESGERRYFGHGLRKCSFLVQR